MLKRLYHGFVLVALINFFALGGFMVFLFATNRLNANRVEQIASVLRGEYDAREEVPSRQPDGEGDAPETSSAELRRLEKRREFATLVSQRHLRELEDRRRLDEQVLLEARRLLEQLREREQAFEQRRAQAAAVEEREGFERQLAVLSRADARKAKDLLKDHTSEADAVALLMAMDENRVKGIVNACKSPDEMRWIGEILNRIGEKQGMPAAVGTGAGGELKTK